MTKTDRQLYKALLELLKSGDVPTISKVSRDSKLSRQTIYRKLEKFTYQDLSKYRIPKCQ